MKEKGLSKEYTVEGLLLELEKIKQIELTSGDVLLTELTKKNRKIKRFWTNLNYAPKNREVRKQTISNPFLSASMTKASGSVADSG